MLQLIAAILSLLLLAGMFGSGLDDDADAPGMPAENPGAAQDGIDFGDLPQTNP
ncbi:hypothetical protein [Rhodanobacter sp. B05]|uniref:hypothetical protein n=1 Tax=Rhodanobacter sp. B05 TaxID=1945859 RepID=UPI0014391FA4|nr:hypothetical protein [Rhodanobacter sp. B05]